MKRLMIIVGFALLLLTAASQAAAQAEEATDKYTVWLGGHYTDFKDYTKKVGEYRLLSDNVFPEFRFTQFSRRGSSTFDIDGHYFDYENSNGRVKSIVGDLFKGEFQYRSLTKQSGQDLLQNMETRESVGGNPGGKMITHELIDPGADYKTHREELTSKVDFLVSRRNNVRMAVAHRMIRENGEKQGIANNHCFSCHLTSSRVKVEKRTHEIETGIQAEAGQYDFGYLFGYRQFQSQGPAPYAYYDEARHPVNGTAGAEFGSRQLYDDISLPFEVLPETEKMSHKVNLKGDLGKGRFSGALFYSKVENSSINYAATELKSTAYGGQLKFAVPLSNRTRLITGAVGNRIKNNDPFIDLPVFRDGRPGIQTDFDYFRYSSLDRKTIKGSAEVIHRMGRKVTVSALAGYDYVMRYDYPDFESEYATTKMIGQLKVNYREGLKYSVRGKYRFEKTSDPFTSGRGLFEARGREALQREYPGFAFVFYFQREDLRYQDITTLPTDRHELDINANVRADSKINLALGLKAAFDKNGDLDSLDVKHFMMQPNINLTVTPNSEWVFAGGYSYNYNKSRGPVTVALFDG